MFMDTTASRCAGAFGCRHSGGCFIKGIGIKGIAVPSVLVSIPLGQTSTNREQKSAPQPPVVGGFEGETFLRTGPEVAAHPVCQEWRKEIEAWKAR